MLTCVAGMSEGRSNIRRGLTGLEEAEERLARAYDVADPDRIFAAATEAAMWATALDDAYRRLDSTYMARRDDSDDGRVVRGLRWARHRGLHDLVPAQMIFVQEGMTFPVTFPLRFDTKRTYATWRARADIPPLERAQPDNEESYDLAVAGTDVLVTARSALRFFLNETSALEDRPLRSHEQRLRPESQ